MRLPSRTAQAVVALALVAAPAALHAEESAPEGTRAGCTRPSCDPSKPALKDDDLLPAWGVRSKGRLRFQWTVSSFDIDDGHFISATGVGVSFTPWAPRRPNGMRFLNLATMVYVGDWGDDRHGPITWQLAYRPEFVIPTGSSVMDLYVGPRAAWNLSVMRPSHRPGMTASFGAGVGIDLFGGGLGLELGSSAALAIDDTFRPVGRLDGQRVKPRADLTISTDFCFFAGDGGRSGNFCAYPAPSPVQVDLTEPLQVGMVAALTSDGEPSAEVCDAVDAAVSLRAVEGDCEDEAPGDRFFRRLVASSRGRAFEPAARRASAIHDALSACFADYGREAALAKQADRSLAKAEQYLVDPSELRRAIGCEGAGSESTSAFVPDAEQLLRACRACPAACRLLHASP